MVTNSETIEARPVALTTAEGCKIPMTAIEEAAEASPRESLNTARIREFALMYGDGMDGRVNLGALPPLDVIHAISEDVYVLADGWHRIAALRKLGIVNAWCIVVKSEPDRASAIVAAYRHAVTASATGSWPLTMVERRAACVRLRAAGLNWPETAKAAGVSISTAERALRDALSVDGHPQVKASTTPETLARRVVASLSALWEVVASGDGGALLADALAARYSPKDARVCAQRMREWGEDAALLLSGNGEPS